jgi:6-phosphogluconolactonase/glucosamine-6-phosphate isomerase/deaminase
MKPQIRIFKNVEDLSQHAANLFAEQATEAIQERGRFLVALNGGSTPTRMLEFLGNKFRESVDWSRTYIFWGDERIVPPDHPEICSCNMFRSRPEMSAVSKQNWEPMRL